MERYRISLKDILEGIENSFEFEKGKRVKIIHENNGDYYKLISELEKRGIEHYNSNNSSVPEDLYEIDLRKIDLI